VSANLQAALAELTAKRDALNGVIATLQDFLGATAGAVVTPPPPSNALMKVRKAPRQSPPARVTKPAQTGPRADTAAAREEAILTALKRNDGVASSKILRAAMPKEPKLDDDQRTAAYRNCLHRLKVKGLIDRTGDTWSLVGIGSERT